jgi:hypothetical protein
MADLARVTINWTGFIGGPGYTNLYWRDASPGTISQGVIDDAATKVDAWLGAWDDYLPPSVAVQVDSTIDIIDDTNGQLQGFMSVAAKPLRQGAGTGNYSAASGACVNWYTDGVRNGRRVRGRSFMVPLAGNALAGNGTLDDTALGLWRTATTTMDANTGTARLVVWGRPTAPGATDGASWEVTSSTIPDKAAVLRSRRD